MEGEMDFDVFDKGDVDEDYYDNFSRAAESGRMGQYDWGSQEQYEAARNKYIREHGASNIPSWMELSDHTSSSGIEDPLTTKQGAQERLIELEPNINLDDIRLSKSRGKIYIRVLNKKTGNWTVDEPLFTKDGEIRAKVYGYEGFKDATRNRLQELKLIEEKEAAIKKAEELKEQLAESERRYKDLEEHKTNIHRENFENELKVMDLELNINRLKESLEEEKSAMKRLGISRNKYSDENLELLKQREEELKKRGQALQKEEEANKKLEENKREVSLVAKETDDIRKQLSLTIQTLETFNDASRIARNLKTRDLNRSLDKIKDLETTVTELKEEKIEREYFYETQNRLYLDALKMERGNNQKRITELLDARDEALSKFQNATKNLETAEHELSKTKSEFDEKWTWLKGEANKILVDKKQLQQEIKVKEEQLRQMEQAIEDLERQAETQREFIRDQSKTEEEVEAAKEKLEGIQERIAEMESRKENLERGLGLTRREKIKRLLQKAGLGTMLAGAVAGIVSLIMNLLSPLGRGLKKLGNEAGKEFKKLGKQLADTGKKLALALPGLLGSVLSLILRTGGELLKFLGNNIWILVVALGAVLLKSLTEKR